MSGQARRRFPALLSVLALSACTSLAPEYVQPAAPVPVSWPAGDAYLLQSEQALPVVSYRDIFQDPGLQQLIEQALANNRDLAIAAANVAAARAQVQVIRSNQFPVGGVSSSNNAGVSGSGGAQASAFGVQGGVSSFELDLFGRLANATAAQQAQALATEAAARTVRLALIADLATAWAAYGADRDLLLIAQDTAADARRAVELTRLRLEGGIAPGSDLTQAQQVLATAEGDIAQLRTALAQDENLIRLLAGAVFDPAVLPRGMEEVSDAVATLPAGTNSAVLLRRPDVIEAEYLLRAANADIGVARAELFPRISLTGLLGLASSALTSLFTGGAFAASTGVGVSQTIFDAGGRRAAVAVTQAQREAALAAYERAIQTAFREVADALAVQGTISEQLQAAEANTQAAEETARLAEARYRFGIENFLANLDARRSRYVARRAEVAIELAAVVNRIDLYRRLAADSAAAVPPDTGSAPAD
ncbi:efflux transporter outer membrane subunit [Altericroceibacterium xinjiangense]|uniref:efflux transporter outer membrane subunit n=1 Tax=Altericroceibacterium xinjiangense TaxID=762261 RepID=UPI000F7E4D10|nr:efflux transporter outer membrane subunit [Altericroceibacterium xinjiangense]